MIPLHHSSRVENCHASGRASPAPPGSTLPSRSIVGGGSLGVGCVVILSGLSAMAEESGVFSLLIPLMGVGLGVLFFHTAWKVLGG